MVNRLYLQHQSSWNTISSLLAVARAIASRAKAAKACATGGRRPRPTRTLLYRVDYHGGLQYPHFERIGGTEDPLTLIAQPRMK
jgi:hypothetical protein